MNNDATPETVFRKMADELGKEWGRRVRDARTDKHWTQRELANRIGMTQSAIRTWEAGASHPRVHHQLALADALGISVEELFPPDPDASDVRAEVAPMLLEIAEWLRASAPLPASEAESIAEAMETLSNLLLGE